MNCDIQNDLAHKPLTHNLILFSFLDYIISPPTLFYKGEVQVLILEGGFTYKGVKSFLSLTLIHFRLESTSTTACKSLIG